MTIAKYDSMNEEHRRIARSLSVETVLDEPFESSELHIVTTDDGLNGYTYLQNNGKWFVHSIEFEQDVPCEAATKEEACRLIFSMV